MNLIQRLSINIHAKIDYNVLMLTYSTFIVTNGTTEDKYNGFYRHKQR